LRALYHCAARCTRQLPEVAPLMIEAVVLDFDGLILDTETPLRRSWNEIYEQQGFSVSPTAWAEIVGSSADPEEAYELFERHLGHPVDRMALRTRRRRREGELLKREHIMPGVRQLVNDAKAQGVRLAVASSSEREWVVGHLARIGLLGSFEAVACAEDVITAKPAPDLYIEALRLLDVSPDSAMAFEDSVHGVKAAKAAGLFCVAVPNQVTRHLAFPEADMVVDTLADHRLDEFIAIAAANRG